MIFMITGVFSESGGKGPSVLNAAEIDKVQLKSRKIFEQEGGTFRIESEFQRYSALSIGAMQFNKGFILHANDSSKMTMLEITLPDDEYKYFTAYVELMRLWV